ncbi:hypothetical protein J6590_086576 [Homalodisca vitripennis]|nr:hypothetical protein J6590_086576 [Homalodisca vitripennis]
MHSPVRGLEAGFRYEYVGLQQLVADYVGKTSDLTTLVSSTRQKRGLIDVGGQYLKLNSALSEVKDAINLAVQRMARLHLAIEDLAAGKMTSNL